MLKLRLSIALFLFNKPRYLEKRNFTKLNHKRKKEIKKIFEDFRSNISAFRSLNITW